MLLAVWFVLNSFAYKEAAQRNAAKPLAINTTDTD